MALASFPLLVRRWSRSKLHHIDYSKYAQLVEYVRIGKVAFVCILIWSVKSWNILDARGCVPDSAKYNWQTCLQWIPACLDWYISLSNCYPAGNRNSSLLGCRSSSKLVHVVSIDHSSRTNCDWLYHNKTKKWILYKIIKGNLYAGYRRWLSLSNGEKN